MQEETTTPGTTATPGTPAAPPAAAPAAAPAATAPPATAPAAAAPATAPVVTPGAPVRKVITIPREEMAKRVKRAAVQMIQEELGVSLEEAKGILAARTAAAGQPPVPTDRERQLERELAESREKLAKRKERILNLKERHKSELLEGQITQAALAAGVRPDEVDYALMAFQRHTQTDEFAKAPQQPGEFFAALRTKKPHLFVGAAPAAAAPATVQVAASTAAPESSAPGGGPSTAAPVVVQKPVSVDDMTPEEFKRYRARQHSYRG